MNGKIHPTDSSPSKPETEAHISQGTKSNEASPAQVRNPRSLVQIWKAPLPSKSKSTYTRGRSLAELTAESSAPPKVSKLTEQRQELRERVIREVTEEILPDV